MSSSTSEEKNDKLIRMLLMELDVSDVQETKENESESSSSSSSTSSSSSSSMSLLKIWKTFLLQTSYWKKLLSLSFDDNHGSVYFSTLTKEQLQGYFTFGVSCLINFVQVNITGPNLRKQLEEYLNSDFLTDNNFNQMLSINNEEINVNTKYPCLLVAAKYIFKHCKLTPLLNYWWQWRTIIIHQQVLDELSPSLLSIADNLQKEIKQLTIEEGEPFIELQIKIRFINVYHF